MSDIHRRKQAETVVQTPDQASVRPKEAFCNGAIIAGKYLIEERIAQGGIGVIVAARHLALQKRVAIKYLRPEVLGDEALAERFEREARLAAGIHSEHVVRIHDVGTLEDAGPYMVMEYLVGNDLSRSIQKGALPIARAVDYVLQTCDALAEAHALGIVHRDIKPENLFLAKRPSNTPILKVLDFGIAKAVPKRGDGGQWARQTSNNERLGTPLYMSPEQLQSTAGVDARTDIWALGVVLHELLTASMPFLGQDIPQLCASILVAAPARLTVSRPGSHPALEAVILKCLEKDPEQRFRNVAELAQELLPFGPPNAAARIERIKTVVRDGGASIRPPRLTAKSRSPDLMSIPQLGHSNSTPDSAVGIAVTIPGIRRVALPRMALVAAAAVAIIGAVVGLASIHQEAGPAAAAARGPAPWSAPVAEPSPAPSATAVPSAVATAEFGVLALPTAQSPSAKPATIARPSQAAAMPKRNAPSTAPTAVDPRAAFGERK
jgi:serine/threonine protein kinase